MNATFQRKQFLAVIQQYAVDFLLDEGFAASGLQVHEQVLLETAMKAIRISFKYPAQVLQQNKEIARYPATLWSHVLDALGLYKYARYTRVMLNEHLAFPGVEIPPELKIGAYVCVGHSTVNM